MSAALEELQRGLAGAVVVHDEPGDPLVKAAEAYGYLVASVKHAIALLGSSTNSDHAAASDSACRSPVTSTPRDSEATSAMHRVISLDPRGVERNRVAAAQEVQIAGGHSREGTDRVFSPEEVPMSSIVKWAVWIPDERRALSPTNAERIWWTDRKDSAEAKAEACAGKVVELAWLLKHQEQLRNGEVML